MINTLLLKTNIITRLIHQGLYYRYGGKIIEKAKASGNFDDNVFKDLILNNFETNLERRNMKIKDLKKDYYKFKASYPKEI
jgi:hypothetical protein